MSDWLDKHDATIAKLEQLRRVDEAAAEEIDRIWPVTLNALRGGINPKRTIKVGKTITVALEVAQRQLDDDLDQALREANARG
jgi:uncharacterized Zn finger protein